MHRFRWYGQGYIAAGADLRHCGWSLLCEDLAGLLDNDVGEARSGSRHNFTQPDCPVLIEAADLATSVWRGLVGAGRSAARLRRWTLVLGVGDANDRARLLHLGFGDVIGHEASLEEVEARAERIAELAESLNRYRNHGVLRLDLLLRDGFTGGKPLGLHPREFALLWRLMEVPGDPVGKTELLREVWRLSFVPETNSIAVHVSRLRGKLARAGLDGWVQTGPAGGYFLAPMPRPSARSA